MRTTGPGLSTEAARPIIVAELTADVRRLCELRALMLAGKRKVRVISERSAAPAVGTGADPEGFG
jgi:hypothetical protein